MERVSFVYSPSLSQAGFPDHVLKPTRLQYTYQLLRAYRALPSSRLLIPRPAREAELLTFHSQQYVEAVKSLSRGESSFSPRLFNMDPAGDNPPYPGMYEASLLPVGASLAAAEAIAQRQVEVVFNPAGGHHHAAPGQASGFCIFNDVVIAIKYLLSLGMRVAYVDVDAHHGDGVQDAFFDTDQVLTISLHEWGRFLFPGTGEVTEIGSGAGQGYAVNLPLFPGSDDQIYLEAFRQVVLPLLHAFSPDVLVTQLGCDTHYADPLTHLCLTVQGYAELVRELKRVAPRWLALGGGGYEMEVVPRAWSAAYSVMTGLSLPEDIPRSYQEEYGLRHLWDKQPPPIPPDLQEEARRFARRSVEEVKGLVFPHHRI